MAGLIYKWNPGDLLSAEKLNSHLQHCNICVVNIIEEYDETGTLDPTVVNYYRLNKTTQELLQALQAGDYIIIKDNKHGVFYLEVYNLENNQYSFSFYFPREGDSFTFTANNLTDYPRQGGR